MSQIEQTLVIIKPDGVKRGLVGEIIKRYEAKQLHLLKLKMIMPTREILEKHYEEHIGKPFYENLIAFMRSGEVVVMVLEGPDAISIVRKINGATKYLEAEMGSIRGDYATDTTANLIHGSDSIKSALREIEIWFKER